MSDYQPILRPSKFEMTKAIRKWVEDKCGIPHANVLNLDRLNEVDLELIYLALGFKLDLRHIAAIERYHQNIWEMANRHRTVDSKAVEIPAIEHKD